MNSGGNSGLRELRPPILENSGANSGGTSPRRLVLLYPTICGEPKLLAATKGADVDHLATSRVCVLASPDTATDYLYGGLESPHRIDLNHDHSMTIELI